MRMHRKIYFMHLIFASHRRSTLEIYGVSPTTVSAFCIITTVVPFLPIAHGSVKNGCISNSSYLSNTTIPTQVPQLSLFARCGFQTCKFFLDWRWGVIFKKVGQECQDIIISLPFTRTYRQHLRIGYIDVDVKATLSNIFNCRLALFESSLTTTLSFSNVAGHRCIGRNGKD